MEISVWAFGQQREKARTNNAVDFDFGRLFAGNNFTQCRTGFSQSGVLDATVLEYINESRFRKSRDRNQSGRRPDTKSPLSRVSTPQLRILLWRKIQPDSAHSFAERGFKLLSPSNIQCKASTFRHFPNLLIISEGQGARQRCLHVIFEKLAMPALPEHEVHIDTLRGGAPAAITQPFAASMGKR